MRNNIKILPHHIGLFTEFYLGDRNKIRSWKNLRGEYSDSAISNLNNVFYEILVNPNSVIKITLEKPDSICFPEMNKKCKECLEGKLQPDRHIVARLSKDKNYKKYHHTVEILGEIEHLLHYSPLKPEKDYQNGYFKRIVEKTGRSINHLLKSYSNYRLDTFLFEDKFSPEFLEYVCSGDEEKVAKHFPLVSKFVRSKLHKLFIDPAIDESIITGRYVEGSYIKKLMKDFPTLFSGSPNEIYNEVINIIKN